MRVTRRAFVVGSAAAIACRRSFSTPDELAAVIAENDRPALRERITALRDRGVTADRFLEAAWLAPIRHGFLPSDVHVILVLPAISRLNSVTDAWPAVQWAIENSNVWCQKKRSVSPLAERSSAEALLAAVRSGDEALATKRAFGVPFDDALTVLAEEALHPRDDPHATIYAAQLSRAHELWPALRVAEVTAHLASYLARRPRTLSEPMMNEPIESIAARAASAPDVHALTHLEAVVTLLGTRLSDVDQYLHPRLSQLRGSTRLVRDPAVLARGTTDDVHAYKGWAAAEALIRSRHLR